MYQDQEYMFILMGLTVLLLSFTSFIVLQMSEKKVYLRYFNMFSEFASKSGCWTTKLLLHFQTRVRQPSA